MNGVRPDLLDALREDGHAVADELGVSAFGCGELIDQAARFVDAALSMTGTARSGHAYIRFSCLREILFVEITHLSPGTFDTLMADDAVMSTLAELRAWARDSAQALAIERGPRDQFRITVVLEPGCPVDSSQGCLRATRRRRE